MRSIFLAVFALILCGATGYAERVRYVIDGDTVIMQSNQRVRLIGVDAPEIANKKYGRRAEPYGKEAREHLQYLVESQDVRLEDGVENFDRHGRRLAYLFLSDGTFVNRQMIVDGYAEAYRKFKYKYKEEFRELEAIARAKKIGMWEERPTFWEKYFKKKKRK